MSDDRIQIRVDATLKRKALKAAERRHVSLTILITQLLAKIVEADERKHPVAHDDVEQI